MGGVGGVILSQLHIQYMMQAFMHVFTISIPSVSHVYIFFLFFFLRKGSYDNKIQEWPFHILTDKRTKSYK